jgi:Uncharacterized conserved protein
VPDRVFTPAEANSALPEVRVAAERLVALRRRMHALDDEQRSLVTSIGGNGGGYAAGDLNAAQGALIALAEEAAACVEELAAPRRAGEGPRQRPPRLPAVRDGEPVLLCWRVGEEQVGYWHGLEDGFAGRRPIDWSE